VQLCQRLSFTMGLKVEPPKVAQPKKPIEAQPEKQVVAVKGKLYDITDFSRRHPGGTWISKFAGQDVTCLYESFHPKTGPADKYLKALEVVTPGDSLEGYSIPSPPRHRELNAMYLKFTAELERDGFFKCPKWFLVSSVLVPLTFLLAACYCVEQGYAWPLASALFVIGYGLTGFNMHHAGHLSLTGQSVYDHKLQAFIFDVMIGLYARWWRVRHNRHHAAPNDPEVDPDLETVPLLMWHKDLMNHRKYRMWNKMPIVKVLLAIQRQMFFVYLSFYTYFLHFASRRMASQDVRKKEQRMTTFGVWVNVGILILIFTFTSQPWWRWMVSWAVGQAFTGIYIGWIFALNHFSMPLSSKATHFCETVLQTTLNVRYSSGNRFGLVAFVLDYLSGYLGYQVEHHLFPRMPACNYPAVHDRVVAWVEEAKVGPFVEMDWLTAHKTMVNQFAPAP
jgi:delta8-fatty-acid desaturase